MNPNSLTVGSVRLSAIVHATEDSGKVERALLSACPKEAFGPVVTESRLKGHYGNQISILSLALPASKSTAYLDFLWNKLPRVDREAVLASINSHIDERGGLHLRLDKAECLRGDLRILDSDPVKIEVSFQTRGRLEQQLVNSIRERLDSLTDQPREMA